MTEATEARIRHLEQIRAACDAAIAGEKELLRMQRINALRAAEAPGVPKGQKNRKSKGKRSVGNTIAPLSFRRQVVKLLEDNYPKDFDPQEVSRRTGVAKRSPDGRLSTYSLLARLFREGKISKRGPARYRALPPSKTRSI